MFSSNYKNNCMTRFNSMVFDSREKKENKREREKKKKKKKTVITNARQLNQYSNKCKKKHVTRGYISCHEIVLFII